MQQNKLTGFSAMIFDALASSPDPVKQIEALEGVNREIANSIGGNSHAAHIQSEDGSHE